MACLPPPKPAQKAGRGGSKKRTNLEKSSYFARREAAKVLKSVSPHVRKRVHMSWNLFFRRDSFTELMRRRGLLIESQARKTTLINNYKEMLRKELVVSSSPLCKTLKHLLLKKVIEGANLLNEKWKARGFDVHYRIQ